VILDILGSVGSRAGASLVELLSFPPPEQMLSRYWIWERSIQKLPSVVLLHLLCFSTFQIGSYNWCALPIFSDERIPAAASKIRFASRDGADWMSIPSTIPQGAMNWDVFERLELNKASVYYLCCIRYLCTWREWNCGRDMICFQNILYQIETQDAEDWSWKRGARNSFAWVKEIKVWIIVGGKVR